MSVFSDMVAEFLPQVRDFRDREKADNLGAAFKAISILTETMAIQLAESMEANGHLEPEEILSALVSIAVTVELCVHDLRLTRGLELTRRSEAN